MNTLREALREYLVLRRGLGFKLHHAGLVLSRWAPTIKVRTTDNQDENAPAGAGRREGVARP
jgi:hypothetical protein